MQDAVKRLVIDASIPSTRMNAVIAVVELLGKVSLDRKEQLIQNVLRSVVHDKADEVIIHCTYFVRSIHYQRYEQNIE